MSETKRKPEHWLVRHNNGAYLTDFGKGGLKWGNRGQALRFMSPENASSFTFERLAKIVAVYITSRTVKRGHSWSWACRQMLAGKKVRRASWGNWEVRINLSGCVWKAIPGGIGQHYQLPQDDMVATDWEACK